MNTTLRSKMLKSLGLMGLILMATFAYGDNYAYKPIGKGAEQILKKGQQWQTDEVLRLSMDNIRQAMAASQDDVVKERLGAQDYQRLAKLIDKNLNHIAHNSKLNQNSSKAFHVVVTADLMSSSEIMRASPNLQAQRVGALGALQTLRNYGKYFQHPGWTMDAEKAH
jgi:hypothetical protein